MGSLMTRNQCHYALFLLFLAFPQLHASLQLTSFGVLPVESDDITLVFFGNVSYSGTTGEPIMARLEMEQCCMNLTDGTNDCEAMKLVGGLGVIFHPDQNHSLNMYFINIDLLDRKGYCVLRLMTREAGASLHEDSTRWAKGAEFTVPFNTVLNEPNFFQKLLISVGGSTEGFRICDSDNHNAEHECENKDCLTRYAGKRSVYNPTTDSCDKTPDCQDKNQILSPTTGTCESRDLTQRKLRRTFTPQMTQTPPAPPALETEVATAPGQHLKPGSAGGLQCIHGSLITGSNGRPNCTCYSGWTSQPISAWGQEGGINSSRGSHSSAVYKMCNVPSDVERDELGRLLIAIAVVATMIPLGVLLIFIHREKQARAEKDSKFTKFMESSEDEDDDSLKHEEEEDEEEEEVEEEEDPDKIITEIANRREAYPKSSFSQVKDTDRGIIPSTGNVETRTTTRDNIPGSSVSTPSMMHSKRSERLKTRVDEDAEDRLTFSPSSEQFFSPSGAFNPATPTAFSEDSRGCGEVQRTPSMDEILDLNHVEKRKAHLPMSPSNNNVADNPSVIGHNNPFTSTSSHSETMVTDRKKQEWAQYISSHENLPPTKLSKEVILQLEDVNNSNNNTMRGVGAASKVQSLPEMHASSTITTELNQRDTESQQLAYRILSSLSLPRDAAKQEPSRTSIWSNVASENAQTPEPERASRTSSYGDVRCNTIYGNLESDVDSDTALENIAEDYTFKNGRPTVAEMFQENQKIFREAQRHVLHSREYSMESDKTPSEVFQRSSTTSPPYSSVECGKDVDASRGRTAGGATTWVRNCLTDTTAEHDSSMHGPSFISTEAEAAYRVKFSLENALKVSRSRSSTNFF